MGKTQSKRSVDITTEPKKDGVAEEGTGKLEKIEDADQLKPQVNGDTNHSENEAADKTPADTEGTENEKDLSTEKEQNTAAAATSSSGAESPTTDAGASGDATATTPTAAEGGSLAAAAEKTDANESKSDAGAADTTAESGESSKKSKKEKVKKKWSFRSISFGKKDKQKPSKKEEGTAAATSAATTATTATNGECEKVPEETTEEPAAAATTPADATEKPTETKTEDNTTAAAAPSTPSAAVTEEETKPSVDAAAVAAPSDVEENKPADVAESAPSSVTNGDAAPAEKAAAAVEPTPESVPVVAAAAPAAPSIVAEEAKVPEAPNAEASVPTTNGTVEKANTNETVEAAKVLNGTAAESPKIEVKTENDENTKNTTNTTTISTNITATTTTPADATSSVVDVPSEEPATNPAGGDVVVQKTITEQLNEQITTTTSTTTTTSNDNNSGGESIESVAQNSPPPPLPCSPPPSQVMVFALSDEDSQVANSTETDTGIEQVAVAPPIAHSELETSTNKQTTEDTTMKDNIPEILAPSSPEQSQTTVLVTPATPENQTTTTEVNIIPATPEITQVNIIPATPENQPETTAIPEAPEEVKDEVKKAEEEHDLPQQQEAEVLEKLIEVVCTTAVEQQPSPTLPPIDAENVEIPSSIEEGIEKNVITAQTIALIDELTQEAISRIEQQQEQTVPVIDSNQSGTDELATEIKKPETECNSPPTAEDELPLPLPPLPASETIPSPISEQTAATVADDISTSSDKQTEQLTPSSQTTTNQNVESDINRIVDSKIEPKIDTEITSQADVLATPQEKTSSVANEQLAASPKSGIESIGDTIATNGDQLASHQIPSATKENGIGDSHEQPAETSATESLNGGVEHKTIEELKAENQIEKVSNDVVTQEAAVVAE